MSLDAERLVANVTDTVSACRLLQLRELLCPLHTVKKAMFATASSSLMTDLRRCRLGLAPIPASQGWVNLQTGRTMSWLFGGNANQTQFDEAVGE